jgi:hypothetical protein
MPMTFNLRYLLVLIYALIRDVAESPMFDVINQFLESCAAGTKANDRKRTEEQSKIKSKTRTRLTIQISQQ